MSAVYVSNIVINAGTDFSQTFTLESSNSNSALDLSGYSVDAQMRKWSGSSTSYTFTTSIVSSSEGKINILLDSSITSTIKPGRYIYDILITKNSITTRVIEGMVLVREGVTR
jgi:hypothetical protein